MKRAVAFAIAFALALWLMIGSSMSAGAASATDGSTPPASTGPVATQAPAPSPSPDIVDTIDPRSNGQGPGLVGSPFAILVGVILLGGATAGATLLYIRLTRRA